MLSPCAATTTGSLTSKQSLARPPTPPRTALPRLPPLRHRRVRRTVTTLFSPVPNAGGPHRQLGYRRGSCRRPVTGGYDPFPSVSAQLARVPTDAMVLSSRRAQSADKRQPMAFNATIAPSRNIGLDGWRSVLAAQPSSPQSRQQRLRSVAIIACRAL
jgi:hypothetical protein